MYANNTEQYKLYLEKAKKLAKKAIELFTIDKDYKAAVSLSVEALHLYQNYATKADINLATAYRNTGNILLKLDQIAKAQGCFQFSLALLEKYNPSRKADIQKCQLALQKCQTSKQEEEYFTSTNSFN
jgi:tetratricopeptide (TPR) repeat protein